MVPLRLYIGNGVHTQTHNLYRLRETYSHLQGKKG